MRVGPIGPSPYAIFRLRGPAATAFRSAPAQKVPLSPQSTATRAVLSRSKARNASASALPVGRSIALRRSGRSRMIVVTTPYISDLTLGRSMIDALPRSAHAIGDTVGESARKNLTRRRAVGYQELSLRCS